jgi:hypothetical protein
LHLHTWCIHYLDHIHPSTPFPHHLPSPTIATHLSPHNLYHTSVFWFHRRKNIKYSKRNMTLLLVWDKDSYTGNFLVLFPCMYVL